MDTVISLGCCTSLGLRSSAATMTFIPELADYQAILTAYLPKDYEALMNDQGLVLILTSPTGVRVPITGLFPHAYVSAEQFEEQVSAIANALRR